ncbi:MAG: HupE/UreJ family protein, partial [Bryobacteraceae bacterium]
MRSALLFLVAAVPLAAHVVSISAGEARVEGSRLTYELRMPLYEIAHIADPQVSLWKHIRFTSNRVDGRIVEHNCLPRGDNYVCRAVYEFPSEIDRLQIECTFASITVPNHVHMLRATKGDRTDQAVFDESFTEADLRFRPPTAAELAMKAIAEGVWRAVAGAMQLLFLASLALAARSRRELLALAGAFLAGELLACALAPHVLPRLSPRFLEAATALTVAYLAVEILLLPKAGQRWIVVGVLGLFHGLYFALFLTAGEFNPALFLAGVLLAELVVIAALALIFSKLARVARAFRPVPVAASV